MVKGYFFDRQFYKWSKEDDQLLIQNADRLTVEEIAELVVRSVWSVRKRGLRLKIKGLHSMRNKKKPTDFNPFDSYNISEFVVEQMKN